MLQPLHDIHLIKDRLKSETGAAFEVLAGNHEVAMLAFLKDPLKGDNWLDWGGLQTLPSFGLASPSREPSETELIDLRNILQSKTTTDVSFLKFSPQLLVSGDVVLVHAGLDPDVPLDAQPEESALWGNAPSAKDCDSIGSRRNCNGALGIH